MSQLHSPDFWSEIMQGRNPVSNAADDSWPRLMANLDPACKGEQIGIQAILETLSRVQLAAKLYLSARELDSENDDGLFSPEELDELLRDDWHERAAAMRGAL